MTLMNLPPALDTLTLQELHALLQQTTAHKESLRRQESALFAELDRRFNEHARLLRQQAGKDTGTVRFERDGFVVVADLPKKPEYDQKKLREAVEKLRRWGENPDDYVSIEIKVSETKYGAWPSAVRQLFEPARTLKTGKPSYKLEARQNEPQIGEVA